MNIIKNAAAYVGQDPEVLESQFAWGLTHSDILDVCWIVLQNINHPGNIGHIEHFGHLVANLVLRKLIGAPRRIISYHDQKKSKRYVDAIAEY